MCHLLYFIKILCIIYIDFSEKSGKRIKHTETSVDEKLTDLSQTIRSKIATEKSSQRKTDSCLWYQDDQMSKNASHVNTKVNQNHTNKQRVDPEIQDVLKNSDKSNIIKDREEIKDEKPGYHNQSAVSKFDNQEATNKCHDVDSNRVNEFEIAN